MFTKTMLTKWKHFGASACSDILLSQEMIYCCTRNGRVVKTSQRLYSGSSASIKI